MPKRDTFEATLRGEQDAPYIPGLRSDPPPYHPQPHSIADFIKGLLILRNSTFTRILILICIYS